MWRVLTPATAGAAVGGDTNRLIKVNDPLETVKDKNEKFKL